MLLKQVEAGLLASPVTALLGPRQCGKTTLARNAYFWATQSRAELDLLLHAGGKRWGFEFKCQDAPVMTPSLRTALEDVRLDRAWIVYPGSRAYPVHERGEAVPLDQAMEIVRKLR